ncbi:MAG: YceI family protein [Arenimonas sp.]
MRHLILCLAFVNSSAFAADYVQQPGSSLGFTGSYQGEAFTGSFAKFNSIISFDPTKLAQSKFDVRITLSSANTKNSERDEMLAGADFFNTKVQPEARYLATKFRGLGGNRFVADGVLTLHGISKAAPLTFTWTAGAKPQLVGTAKLQRLDFKVGIGDWDDVELIPNAVTVNTRLILSPVAIPASTVKAAPKKP